MKTLFLSVLFFCVMGLTAGAYATEPVVTDSRIKTFVYNEYDVYSIYTHYGYQTNIEFGEDEEIVTVSVGDRIAWQIVPVGRRLFIRPMEENAHTNMTVITSEHTYQFDLRSSGTGKLRPAEELAYVIRFYYPEKDERLSIAPPAQAAQMIEATMPVTASYNYQYTYTGPDALAPTKIFDNGTETYFQVQPQNGVVPRVFVVGPDGKEYPVSARRTDDGFAVVRTVAPRFVVRYSASEYVCIYNEAI